MSQNIIGLTKNLKCTNCQMYMDYIVERLIMCFGQSKKSWNLNYRVFQKKKDFHKLQIKKIGNLYSVTTYVLI